MPHRRTRGPLIGAHLIGRRVVLRSATATSGAPYRDTLGDLIALDDERATVATRDALTHVALDSVVLARVVEPATLDQLALERVAARGWQAATTVLSDDGWLLRADTGWTGRANSALVLRSLRRPLPEALADVRAFYARHGLPPRLSVPLPAFAGLNLALQEAGWPVVDGAHVLTTRLDLLTNRPRPDTGTLEVTLSCVPSPAWLAACQYRGGPMPAGGAPLLQRHDRARFAQILDGDRIVALARGVVDDGWLGITVLDVDAAYRRRGLATTLLLALAQWAGGAGATRAYLQVGTDNAGALACYEALGWHRHHGYVYRTAVQEHS